MYAHTTVTIRKLRQSERAPRRRWKPKKGSFRFSLLLDLFFSLFLLQRKLSDGMKKKEEKEKGDFSARIHFLPSTLSSATAHIL